MSAEPCDQGRSRSAHPQGLSRTAGARLFAEGLRQKRSARVAALSSCTDFRQRCVQVGSDETLIDNSVRFVGDAGSADVAVTLEIWPHVIHAWPMWNAHLEAGRLALASAGAFMRRHITTDRARNR